MLTCCGLLAWESAIKFAEVPVGGLGIVLADMPSSSVPIPRHNRDFASQCPRQSHCISPIVLRVALANSR